jgi:hypothetical protein
MSDTCGIAAGVVVGGINPGGSRAGEWINDLPNPSFGIGALKLEHRYAVVGFNGIL